MIFHHGRTFFASGNQKACRYAFQGPRAARALLGSPPADRALAYAKVADRVIGDLDRLGLAVRARRARRQLPAEGSSPRPVEDRTPRRVRPIEAGGAEQCYHQRTPEDCQGVSGALW